jgi:PAS domain S-box-containing protein
MNTRNPADTPEPTAPTRRTETEERIEADRRRRQARLRGGTGQHHQREPGDPRLINAAVAALCEGVRDYAIFVLNAQGVIVYWGMGAHLMKWWLPEEAEGAHLRLLYPEGGSEDGTAEGHLIESAATGEYVGQGQRIRRGGSTFWAHVTLTALRDPEGELLGFVKVTQDLTKRRATESAVAWANEAQSASEAASAMAQEAQAARERAEEALRRAEASRERAEQAAAFAREQARSVQEHMARVARQDPAVKQAERGTVGAESDAYMQAFASLERGDAEPGKKEDG